MKDAAPVEGELLSVVRLGKEERTNEKKEREREKEKRIEKRGKKEKKKDEGGGNEKSE